MQVETAPTKAAIVAAVYTATATHPKTIHRNTCQSACASKLAVSSMQKPFTTISSTSEMGMFRNEHTDKLCAASDVPEGCSILQSQLPKCPWLQVPQMPPDTLLPPPAPPFSTYTVPSTDPNSYVCRNTSQMRKMCHHIKNLLP